MALTCGSSNSCESGHTMRRAAGYLRSTATSPSSRAASLRVAERPPYDQACVQCLAFPSHGPASMAACGAGSAAAAGRHFYGDVRVLPALGRHCGRLGVGGARRRVVDLLCGHLGARRLLGHQSAVGDGAGAAARGRGDRLADLAGGAPGRPCRPVGLGARARAGADLRRWGVGRQRRILVVARARLAALMVRRKTP